MIPLFSFYNIVAAAIKRQALLEYNSFILAYTSLNTFILFCKFSLRVSSKTIVYDV